MSYIYESSFFNLEIIECEFLNIYALSYPFNNISKVLSRIGSLITINNTWGAFFYLQRSGISSEDRFINKMNSILVADNSTDSDWIFEKKNQFLLGFLKESNYFR